MVTKQLTPYERKETLRGFLEKNKNAITAGLPKFMTPERLIGQLFTTINAKPELLDATPRSLISALLFCGSVGLEPSILGHVYLVPFRNKSKGTIEVQTLIGYKGLAMLARRSDMIENIEAGVVYDGDSFDFQLGSDPFVHYKPNPDRTDFGNPDDILWAWCSYKVKGSKTPQVTVLSKNKIIWHRERYSKAKSSGPWVDNFEAMAMKTAIRINMKLAPLQSDLHSVIAMDEMAESQLSQEALMPALPEALEEKLHELEGEVEPQDEAATPGVTIPQWAAISVRGRTLEELSPAQLKTFAKTLIKRMSGATRETNPHLDAEQTLLLAIGEKLGSAHAPVKEAPTEEPQPPQAQAAEQPVVTPPTTSAPSLEGPMTDMDNLKALVEQLKNTPNGRWLIIDILDRHHIQAVKKATPEQCKVLIEEFRKEVNALQDSEPQATSEIIQGETHHES